MAKVLKCKDAGMDCDYEARGKTVDEVLEKAKRHAMKEHDVRQVSQDYLDSWRKLIKDE
jgi:predicted small metal-binding protein